MFGISTLKQRCNNGELTKNEPIGKLRYKTISVVSKGKYAQLRGVFITLNKLGFTSIL